MNDLIIIGAGPGGCELAIAASKNGLSTTLIEKDRVGGTCLNSGCIPTKTYYQNAKLIKGIKNSHEFGITIDNYQFDFHQAKKRKDDIVESLNKGIIFSLAKANVKLVTGEAKLFDKNTVIVGDDRYYGKNIVIATGSQPIKLPGFEKALTSTEILSIDHLPQKLVIIGGGVIGIEMASIFYQLGVEVEVVEMMDRIIPNADFEISKRLLTYLKKQGIKFHLSSKAISYNEDVVIESKGTEATITCDQVLVSIGRKPNLQTLNLDNLGIIYDRYGIKVNDKFQTNIDSIYAIGDVNGRMMLAHYATYSGYHVLKHILKKPSNINFYLVPNCVFTFPEVAWVGLTEEVVKDMQIEYQIHKGIYRANGKAVAMNETDGFIKAIVVDGIIKGVHIIGAEASVLIHEMVAVMNKNTTVDEFIDIIHAHPTLSELFTLTFH